MLQQPGRCSREVAVKRKVPEQWNVLAGETKLIRRKRRLPAAMISYVKPRRKRHFLSIGISRPSSRDAKSRVKDSLAESSQSKKPAVAELVGRRTSASIMSRYQRLDQQRSQSRRMSGRVLSAEDRSRPSTRSQTAAQMHRQLVIARMKSVEETEASRSAAQPSSENYSCDDPQRSGSSHRHKVQTTMVRRKLSEEKSPRQSTLGLKKEALEGEESERSMRRFIRRRNFDASGANKGQLLLLSGVRGLRII